jgi:hypothetical protein
MLRVYALVAPVKPLALRESMKDLRTIFVVQ